MKHCKHCGNTQIKAKIIHPGIVEMNEDGTFTILKEATNKTIVEVYECMACKQQLAESDLVSDVICSQCGNKVDAATVDENGICADCQLLNERPDLTTLSQADYIRKIVELERLLKGSKAEEAEVKETKASKPRATKKKEEPVVVYDRQPEPLETPVETETIALEEIPPVTEDMVVVDAIVDEMPPIVIQSILEEIESDSARAPEAMNPFDGSQIMSDELPHYDDEPF